MMRYFAVPLSAVLAFACTVVAFADPAGDLVRVGQNFSALHSVHVDMTTKDGTPISLDLVEPHKVRASAQGMQVVIIGHDAWLNFNGQWRHAPDSVGNMVTTQMEVAATAKFQKSVANDFTVTDAGPAVVRGIATHKYHMVNKKNGEATDVWVANNLPVRIVSDGATIDYSKYNQVADITPPA